MQNFLQKMLPWVVKFSNLKIIRTLKVGFIRTVPLTLIGSLFLLLANFPINGYGDFMTGIFGAGWRIPLVQISRSTFNVLAIYTAFAIAHEYVIDEELDGVPAGFFAVAGLLANIEWQFVDGIGLIIPNVWLGGQGLITAIFVGLISGYLYTWFIKRDIRIKLPESVPPAVANSFSALIPGAVILTTFMVIHIICHALTGNYVTQLIYAWLQIPLQNLTDTLPGIIIVSILISLLWWCGIHGDAIVLKILSPITTANMTANKELVDAGVELVAGDNARIITEQFLLFLKAGGAGATIGLVISMICVAKSKQLKELGKLALGPSLFNINEPIIFGTPIIYNPIMIVPFILAPTLSVIIAYFAISTGIVPPFGATNVPWPTPTILSGFLCGGFRTALLQVLLVILSIVIYFPFVKMQDKMLLEQEAKADAETVNTVEE